MCSHLKHALTLALLAGWAVLCGCETTPPGPTNTGSSKTPENTQAAILHEGDVLKITFAGAHSLDSIVTIRRDGMISMSLVPDIKASGLTTRQLEEEVLKAYKGQLAVEQVSVAVQSSTFAVYVTGAVLRPGKIVSDRVLTPLEAVMEAGVDSMRSNLKKVVVIREHENGKPESWTLDLDAVMKGKPTPPFTLMPMDKINVKEKTIWF